MKIAFICTGNSARSQIAEGFGKFFAEYFKKDIQIFSAGSKPAGYVHPIAIKVMSEIGIDISRQSSNSLKEIPMDEIDLIITLCGDAKENCPVVPGVKTLHWEFPDPAKAPENEKLEVFRYIRDQISKKVKHLIKDI